MTQCFSVDLHPFFDVHLPRSASQACYHKPFSCCLFDSENVTVKLFLCPKIKPFTIPLKKRKWYFSPSAIYSLQELGLFPILHRDTQNKAP